MKRTLLLLGLLIGGGLAWIRLAPSDPARWHVDPGHAPASGLTASPPDPGSVIRVRSGARANVAFFGTPPAAALEALDAVALATPRTRRLAGSPQEGRITWITRSAVFGFPDYTTAEVRVAGEMVTVDLHARQRFGRKDAGVNEARLRDWLARLAARQGRDQKGPPR